MKARFYFDGNPVHDRCIEAMYEGCPLEDKTRATFKEIEACDFAIVFGMAKNKVPFTWPRQIVRMVQELSYGQTIILDSGYVQRGDGPHDYYAVGLNGLNGRAEFLNYHMPGDRWAALDTPLQPWRKDGGHILLIGQVPWDASVQHIDFCAWAESTVGALRERATLPIIYRPHPKAKMPPISGADYSTDSSLDDDLRDCWAVVTYNSNSGVDALIAGYPVFAADHGSMAWLVANRCLSLINKPKMHAREQWARDLAYTQWTPEEMREGKPWMHLTRLHESSSATIQDKR